MKRVFTMIFLMLVSVGCLTGCSLYTSMMASKEMADPAEHYHVAEGEAAVLLDSVLMAEKGIVRDSRVYLPLDLVCQEMDKRFYWDGKDDRVLFTDAEKIYEETVSDREMALTVDEQLYLSTACLEKYLNIQVEIFHDPDRVLIDTAGNKRIRVPVTRNTQVRQLGGFRSPILTAVTRDSQVQLLEAHEKWGRVRTEDGHVGYLLLECVDQESAEEERIPENHEDPAYTSITMEEPVCLGWHDMENVSGNTQLQDLIQDTSLNVICPTWFALTDNEGGYRNLSSAAYVKAAHKAGLQVWVLVDDFDDNMSIGKVLSDNQIRQKLVSSLITDVEKVKADGINVDFEYISDSCGADYIQFLRELSVECRARGLVLSVDNANPTYVRYCYDMWEQGKIVDYVVLMGYDEHYKGSEAGSVASVGYVAEGIAQAVDMVPAEKVISGLPFYARVWTETPEKYAKAGAAIRQDGNSEYERYSLESSALSMQKIAGLIQKAGVNPEWDDLTEQYYVEIPLKHGKQRIWVEDAASLKAKLDIVSQYPVAGIAFWKLGMEDPTVWDTVSAYLNE